MFDRDKINEAKEKLGVQAFYIMAKEIPLEDFDERRLVCKSPFKQEKTASAYWFDKGNCIKCFATGFTMDYIDFLMRYKEKSFSESVRELFDLVGVEYSESEFVESDCKYKKGFRFARDEDCIDRSAAEDYLRKRCISKETLDFCNVKQDFENNIAYQFFDSNGELIQTKYRVSHQAKNGDKKWFWQHNSDVSPLLYGVNKTNYNSPLLIVEGLNDRLACVESGYTNCVSIPGGANDKNWIDFNFDYLEKFSEIILWFDDDEVGTSAVKECAERIGIYKTKVVQSDKEAKDKIQEFYNQYNSSINKIDANNVLVACGPDKVVSIIQSAKELENPLVKKLMTVDEIQIQDIPKTSTGFSAMDKLFFGTFQNSLTILTGRPGNGKSCILNTMFIAAPMENGEKVFIYSGELPGGILLGNIIKPLASRRHILEFKNDGQPNGYSVSNQASKEIRKYYMDYLYYYNDDNQFDTNSKSILQSMEYSFRRYGVNNFVIDSLLTVDCSCEKGDDKYEKQKNFVISLKNFTNRYPVKVALVAHSRKLAAGVKEIGGDDIAGSSDILKCCNRAFSVEILWDDPEGYNTSVKCIKDRETGLMGKEVKLYYDKQSYRMYSDKEELDKKYSWEYKSNIVYSSELSAKIVDNIKPSFSEVDEVFGTVE